MSLSFLDAEVERLASKASVYGPGTVWEQNEFSEILPFPKPLSLSVLRRLASHDGATGMACRELGLSYNIKVPIEDYIETIFGRTFVNKAAQNLLTGGQSGKSFMKTLISSAKIQQGMKVFYRDFRDIITELNLHYDLRRKETLKKLTRGEMLDRISALYATLNDHYRYVVKAGIFANCSLNDLIAIMGKDKAAHLLTVDSRLALKGNQDALDMFAFREKELGLFSSYSADIEYELACPRFAEKTGETSSSLRAVSVEFSEPKKIASKAKGPLFFFKVYESLKVICKTMLLRELYLLRQALLEYNSRCGLQGDVFYMNLGELLSGREKELAGIIEERKRKEEAFSPIEVPASVVPSELPTLMRGTVTRPPHALKGVSVNGFAFEGRAILYNSDSDIEKAGADAIIVARHASPNMVMAFNRARGIITETGGLLSHLAIVARERGFPLVLQVHDATNIVKSGDRLCVSDAGSVRIL